MGELAAERFADGCALLSSVPDCGEIAADNIAPAVKLEA
jgi:hypothetical protein